MILSAFFQCVLDSMPIYSRQKGKRRITMTRKRTFAAIAILLMALIATTSCEGGGGSGAVSDASAAVSAVRAMTQAVDAVGTDNSVTAEGDGYELKNFKADDGSVINGSFQTDAEGNIIDAKLTMEIKGRTLEFTLTTPSQGASPDVTVDDHDVPASAIPEAMTKEERLAFMMFLVGFDEVQDEIREAVEDSLELFEERKPGTYTIPSGHRISGTVEVGYEERGDDDTEVIGGEVSFTDLRLEGWGLSVSGSFRFTSRDDYENGRMDVTISLFEDDGIILSDVSIEGEYTESKVRDDDRFEFSGSVKGSFSAFGKSSEVSFDGTIDAMEDRYLRFPEYSLRIDGREVAIGREERPFRN